MANVVKIVEIPMFKRYIKYLVILSMTYLVGSFVAWDLNPGNWDSIGRYLTVLAGILLVLINWLREDVERS